MSEEIIERKNPLTVISKNTFGEYNVHDIQSNSSWGKNPYEDYAIVPDNMVESIMETRGFCNIELNEDGTEVVSFTALEIPDIPEPESQPTEEQLRITALEEALLVTDEMSIELYENQMAQEEVNLAQDEALIELYEMVGGE